MSSLARKSTIVALLVTLGGCSSVIRAKLPNNPLPAIKQATAAMRQLVVLVPRPGEGPEQACRDRHVSVSGGDRVCRPESATAALNDRLAEALSRAGITVVRARLSPYDVELAGMFRIGVAPPATQLNAELFPIKGRLPRDEVSSGVVRREVVYLYHIVHGQPQIVQGLRKNDAGGWRTRRGRAQQGPGPPLKVLERDLWRRCGGREADYSAPRDRVEVASSDGVSSIYGYATYRTVEEGPDHSEVVGRVVNDLVTCDAFEALATALAGSGPRKERVAAAPPARTAPRARAAPPGGTDRDGDGILDHDDQCPAVPEDRDGFQDADGCPDPDNDQDGVADVRDRCPNEPETANGFQDADGCPDQKPAAPPARPAGSKKRPIIAVFDMELTNMALPDQQRRRLSAELGDYLSERLAISGRFRVAPRDSIKKALVGAANESRKDCYKQSCQIQIGERLAAQKVVNSKARKGAERCELTALIFDLAAQVSEQAAAVTSGCGTEGLRQGIRELAEKLAGR